jgi:hypothetical protein
MMGLRWYVARLKTMSPGEVAFRVARAVGHEPRRWVSPDPAVVRQAREEAERLTSGLSGDPPHRVEFFGSYLDFPGPAPIDWSRDYKTGVSAPVLFYRNIDYRDESQVGDSKWIWELNRHQFLAPWALEYRRTGEERHAEAVVALVCDWIARNPRYVGINWSSALELALRILSWGIALDLCAASPAVRRARPLIAVSVAQQARFIRRTLSMHSSANNHLLGELVGLMAAGAFFGDLPDARRHARFAARRLWREALLQNERDGVNREQAAYYHHYALEYLLTATVLASRLGWGVPHEVLERVRRMLAFADALTDDAGEPFEIGDRDDGTVTGLNAGTGVTPWESLLWSGWVVFGDPELGAHAARMAAARGGERVPDVRTVCWHGTRLPPAPAPPPTGTRRAFPEGGYFIAADAGCTLLFKAGPFGYPSIAAHAHCDQLSVLLRRGDRTVLTDAGTYVYHTEDRWRRFFRGTSAHNTVGVDGVDQAEYAGPFMWATHARGRLSVMAEGPDGYEVRGSHDGYRRLADPVEHDRRVTYRSGLGWRIADRLSGAVPHRFEIFWNLAVGVVPQPVAAAGGRRAWLLLVDGEPVLGLVLHAREEPEVREMFGDEDGPAGFESRRYLEKSPIHHIRAGVTAVRWHVETFLVPLDAGTSSPAGDLVRRTEAWG